MAPGSIPTQFPNCPSYLSKRIRKRKLPKTRSALDENSKKKRKNNSKEDNKDESNEESNKEQRDDQTFKNTYENNNYTGLNENKPFENALENNVKDFEMNENSENETCSRE